MQIRIANRQTANAKRQGVFAKMQHFSSQNADYSLVSYKCDLVLFNLYPY